MELTKKCVLVFGPGISGIGAAHLLLAKGAEVILYDGNTEKDKDALLAEFPAGSQVRIVLGELPEAEMEQLDLVVMSPGVPCDLPVVLAMKEKGIHIWGEVESAYECGKGDVLAVTGTNGKTTNERCPERLCRHTIRRSISSAILAIRTPRRLRR